MSIQPYVKYLTGKFGALYGLAARDSEAVGRRQSQA
jgi:hypothetical protein